MQADGAKTRYSECFWGKPCTEGKLMPDVWGADWWDAWMAFGTVGATTIAILLALLGGVRARRAELALASDREERAESDRISTASLVSAWIETTYQPSADGTHFLRRGTLHIANESNEPIFEIYVAVGVGRPPVQIGPLAVPTPIPVMPSRRHRSWDVSLGLLAHGGGRQIPSDPVVKLNFTDSKAVRWNRDFDGDLCEGISGLSDLTPDEAEGMRQIGDPLNFFNPVGTALAFLNLVQREEPPATSAELSPLLADKAPGWKGFDDTTIQSMREEWANYGMAAHVYYPAPQVAYIRLLHEADQEKIQNAAGVVEVRAHIITLVFYAGTGWKIFSAGEGATEPDWIEFPPGTIADDPRG